MTLITCRMFDIHEGGSILGSNIDCFCLQMFSSVSMLYSTSSDHLWDRCISHLN